MRNLSKRGLGFYSPQRTYLISSAYRQLLDREEVRYDAGTHPISDIKAGFTRGYMAVNRSIRDPRTFAFISILVVVLTLSSMLMVGSDRGKAGVYPVNVRGHVFDLAGNGIQGANVTVDIMVGSTIRTTRYYDATLASGLYTVSFQGSEFDIGNTIRTTATYDVYTNQNSTEVLDPFFYPIQWVDVTLSMSIPEFGSIFGVPGSFVAVGMIAAIVVVHRRRPKNPVAPS